MATGKTKTKATPKTFDLTHLQAQLAAQPLYPDKPDGKFGIETRQALRAALVTADIGNWQSWSDERLVIAGKQTVCALAEIDTGTIDGLLGPQTRYAFEVYEARLNGNKEPEKWRDNEQSHVPAAPGKDAAQHWPRQKDCTKFFGRPGQNQVRLALPYAMRLAWDTDTIVRSTLCHEKIHDAAARAIARSGSLRRGGDQGPRTGSVWRLPECP